MIRPRTSVGDKASKSARGRAAARVTVAAAKSEKPRFTAELHHVIDLARAIVEVSAKSSGDGASNDDARNADSKEPSPAALQLHRAIGELAPESALKLCALLLAGQDGREIAAAVTTTLGAEANSWFSAHALGRSAAKLADYLQRGHAIACATDFDIEAPIAKWARADAPSLEDRVWLSFGKQLASSDPTEWHCLGLTADPENRRVTALYMQCGEKAWWSFRRVLDRPSPSVVRQARRSATRGKSKDTPASTLQSVLRYSVGSECAALQRAVRAIRARLGVEPDQARA